MLLSWKFRRTTKRRLAEATMLRFSACGLRLLRSSALAGGAATLFLGVCAPASGSYNYIRSSRGLPQIPRAAREATPTCTPEAALATPPYIIAHPFEFQAPSATCTKAPTPEGEDSRFVERLLREGMDKVTSQQEADFQDLAKQDTDSFFAFLK